MVTLYPSLHGELAILPAYILNIALVQYYQDVLQEFNHDLFIRKKVNHDPRFPQI